MMNGSEIKTDIIQTAESFITAISLNGQSEGYSMYSSATAFADLENNCIRIVNISSDEVYGVNSDEFKELNRIFSSYSIK